MAIVRLRPLLLFGPLSLLLVLGPVFIDRWWGHWIQARVVVLTEDARIRVSRPFVTQDFDLHGCVRVTFEERRRWLDELMVHGTYTGYDGEGRVCLRGQVRLGRRDGVWRQYREGVLFKSITYADDIHHGPLTVWFDNGQAKFIDEYDQGRRHGHWTWFHRDGSLRQRTAYHHGSEHGTHTMWYANGQKASEWEHHHGRVHGRLRSWSEDGVLRRDEQWRGGWYAFGDHWDRSGRPQTPAEWAASLHPSELSAYGVNADGEALHWTPPEINPP